MPIVKLSIVNKKRQDPYSLVTVNPGIPDSISQLINAEAGSGRKFYTLEHASPWFGWIHEKEDE